MTETPPIPREALLPIGEVVRLTNLCQAQIYARMKDGTFPLARQIGVRRIAWLAAEVFDWTASLPKWQPAGKPVAARAKEPSDGRQGVGDRVSKPGIPREPGRARAV